MFSFFKRKKKPETPETARAGIFNRVSPDFAVLRSIQ